MCLLKHYVIIYRTYWVGGGSTYLSLKPPSWIVIDETTPENLFLFYLLFKVCQRCFGSMAVFQAPGAVCQLAICLTVRVILKVSFIAVMLWGYRYKTWPWSFSFHCFVAWAKTMILICGPIFHKSTFVCRQNFSFQDDCLSLVLTLKHLDLYSMINW